MILQALNDLYDRLVEDPSYAIAGAGYSLQKIAFAVVLHPDGRLHRIEDVRDTSGKQPVPVQHLVPGQAKRSGSGLNPCFLWDNAFYLLGYTDDPARKDRATRAFEAFKTRNLEYESELDDPAYHAVCRFLEAWKPDQAQDHPVLEEIKTGFGVFQLVGEAEFVHERAAIRSLWASQQEPDDSDGRPELCLVTGAHASVAQIHEPKIKGIRGAQSAGALLVSFNCDAFGSYGKEQGRNAPVSAEAAFRYCTALNGLLSGPRSDRHRFVLADTTVTFWTGKATTAEKWLSAMFQGEHSPGETQAGAALQQTRARLEALRNGGAALRALGDDPDTPVYLLGLAPNAARLAVRFWHNDSLGRMFDRLRDHFGALRIIRQFDEGTKRPDPEFPPAWMLLRETAREPKDIPPLLAGALLRAILQGSPYPDALASAVFRRIRADRTVSYCRAAILKAWLTRKPNRQGGIPVSLDPERPEPAYRLGRLFAALEKTQEDAQPGINATIRDRFYSAASATPAIVFPRLLRTYQHHLGNLPSIGHKVNREKLVQEILDGLEAMPRHLALETQALFAIGYYHQRKALYTGKPQVPEAEYQE